MIDPRRRTGSLFRKIMISFCLIMLCSSIVAGLFIYRSNQSLFEEEVTSQFNKTNELMMQILTQKVKEIERITQLIVFQPSVVSILTRSGKTDRERSNLVEEGENTEEDPLYIELAKMYDSVSQFKLDVPYIRSMFIYNLENINYYNANESAIVMLEPSIKEYIDQKLEGTNGALIWMRLNLASRADASGSRTMIVAARQMKSTWQETYGTLILVLDEAFFGDMVQDLKETATRMYLLNREGSLLFADSKEGYEAKIPLMDEQEDKARMRVDEDNYLFVKNESGAGQMTLVSGLSLKEIERKNEEIFRIIVLSGMISMALTVALLALANVRLLRPLRELVFSMRKIRLGQLKTRIEVRSTDELAYLGESFNDMLDHIDQLINEVFIKQLREKEAELRALQAQLNPHFLYNIFNEIYWKLYKQNVRDTAGIIKSLSDILRYSLQSAERPTTLKEELKQIQSYIDIQMELFHPDLLLNMEVDDDTLQCEIQRLILQPVIENVFVHAFTGLGTEGHKMSPDRLDIYIFKQDDRLRIDISDNGVGLPQTVLSKLQAEGGEHQDRLGIQLVKRRIELVYGSPYSLRFESEEGTGTTASYYLPFIQGGAS